MVRPLEGTAATLADILSRRPDLCATLGGLFNDDVPPGCVTLLPRTTTVRLTFPASDPLLHHGVPLTAFHLRRTAFCVAVGFAYTPHFCQGATFTKGQPWLLHLTPPPTGDINGHLLLVAITRFRCAGDMYLLEPLYDANAEPGTKHSRDQAIAVFTKALRRSPHLDAEDQRLEELNRRTLERELPRLRALYSVEEPPPPPPSTPLILPPVSEFKAQLAAYEQAVRRWE